MKTPRYEKLNAHNADQKTRISQSSHKQTQIHYCVCEYICTYIYILRKQTSLDQSSISIKDADSQQHHSPQCQQPDSTRPQPTPEP